MSDCPKTFEEADRWADTVNSSHDHGPKWKWDCNFKLDYDGPILHFSSRFYPPHKNNHDGWEGFLTVYLLDEIVNKIELKEKTLDELRISAEKHAAAYIETVKRRIATT